MTGLPKGLIDALPKLEICAINGVGLETTDLPAAKARGIVVTTTPVLFDDVADLAIALGMAACRRIAEADRYVRAGKWLLGRMPLGRSFWGKRYGILGLGRIGQALARRLEGFGGTIGYHDPVPKTGVAWRAYGSAVELAASSDILFLCAAGSPGGGVIVGREVLEALGPQGVFVNIARGWLVDEPALVELLANGGLGAAGLDVFADEPNVPEQLVGLDNVVLTPHIASSTQECMRRMGECLIANLTTWFAEGRAVTPVAM
jgi:lactate dehydrogenase-like 2-hydroxyacid dehydrogenase